MEAIEQELEQKGIEKTEPVIQEVKPRKPRSEAQIAAFEKARKKRAENLAKKKLEGEEKAVSDDVSENQTPTDPEKHQELESSLEDGGNASKSAPKKKRGRPKGSKTKLKREPVPEPGQPNFLPPNIPPEAGDIRYQYQQPHHSQFNPWMAYQPPPQVHNYYYGHQQGAVNQAPPPEPVPVQEPEPEPLTTEPDWSSESEDEADYLPAPLPRTTSADPRLKFRFA